MADAQHLQIALGKIRQTFGHFNGRILAIDPHRVKSYSKRQMPRRKKDKDLKPAKTGSNFFCSDAETHRSCFTTACSARTVTQATPEMLTMAAKILKFDGEKPLVMTTNITLLTCLTGIKSTSAYDLLVPMPNNQSKLN